MSTLVDYQSSGVFSRVTCAPAQSPLPRPFSSQFRHQRVSAGTPRPESSVPILHLSSCLLPGFQAGTGWCLLQEAPPLCPTADWLTGLSRTPFCNPSPTSLHFPEGRISCLCSPGDSYASDCSWVSLLWTMSPQNS